MDNYYRYPFRGNHTVQSPFGPRVIAGVPGFHYGVDFGWDPAEGPWFPVLASAEGDVIYYADEGIGGGRTLTLRHAGGETTRYYHLDHNLVNLGDHVLAGQAIALSGDTGGVAPHLHFEIHDKNGIAVDPLPILELQPPAPPVPVPPLPIPGVVPSEEEPMYLMRADDGRLAVVWETRADVFLPGAYGAEQTPAGTVVVKANDDTFNAIVAARA